MYRLRAILPEVNRAVEQVYSMNHGKKAGKRENPIETRGA